MLTENLIAATQAVSKQSSHINNALKDVGIFQYEFQPQSTLRHGFKKSSVLPQCLAISDSHVFAAQSDKAVINVYNRLKGHQEATVPFPDRIHSLTYADDATILIIGTEDGKLVLWELATGRISTSAASHLEAVTHLAITPQGDHIVSGSLDSNVHVWSTSNLVAFSQSKHTYSDETPTNSPVGTFSNHKSGITALAVGHSMTTTNFAVSTSADKTCCIWHLETFQLLRTLLLPTDALSIVLDPADRAIYLGNDDGTIQHIDILGQGIKKSKISIFENPDLAPIQLEAADSWNQSSTDVGAARCLAISHDGTNLVSGHSQGALIRWDIAKQRIISQLANVHQPVTNVRMLTPDGLRHDVSRLTIPEIVKPRLELNATINDHTTGIPASYTLQAQVIEAQHLYPPMDDDMLPVTNGNPFSVVAMGDAVQALIAKSAGVAGSMVNSNQDKTAKYRIEQLQEELENEKRKVAWLQNNNEEREQRYRKRTKIRENLDQKRREAYFMAEDKGLDGEAAMRLYHEAESIIDVESEDDTYMQNALARAKFEQNVKVDD